MRGRAAWRVAASSDTTSGLAAVARDKRARGRYERIGEEVRYKVDRYKRTWGERARYAVARILGRTRETEMRLVKKERREEGRKEDVEGQDGRRSSRSAVQSSTKKSVGPPHRRSSLLLIPTAVLRLYLVPPSSSIPNSLLALSRLFPPSFPLRGRRSSPFRPFCFSLFLALSSRFSRLFFLSFSLRFCRALAISIVSSSPFRQHSDSALVLVLQ